MGQPAALKTIVCLYFKPYCSYLCLIHLSNVAVSSFLRKKNTPVYVGVKNVSGYQCVVLFKLLEPYAKLGNYSL